MADQTRQQYYNRRLSALKLEREDFIPHYKELAEFIRPRRGRFFTSDRNKGGKKYGSIINSVATDAHRTATAGMLAGTMSPARPWFGLESHDPDLMEVAGVKDWLYKVELLLRTIFNESNFYSQASNLIGELLLFGTGCMTHVDDFTDVARFYTHTAGSYYIGQNDRHEVDTLMREFEWTALQIVKAFGIENVSQQIKTAIDRSSFDAWFPVVHMIEPNDEFKPQSKLGRNKPFISVYYEPGNDRASEQDRFLSTSGFDEFPAYVPRWDTTGEDTYGTDCSAMQALGDIKGLQIEEKRKAQGIDKMVAPPLHGPPSVKNINVTGLPSGVNVYDAGENKQELKALYQVDLRLNELRADIDAVERRINKAFYVDMFLAITNMEGIQPRNQLDLMQRNEERLLQLGPVLEHLQGDWLDPLIDRTFNQMVRAGILPPPPEVLQSSPLRVKYISSLAMAQRAVATQGIDRLALFAGGLVQQGWQSAGMKFNAEQAVDEYARAIGTPPSLVVPDEVVAQQKQAQADAQAQQIAMEQAQGAANMMKMAADSKTDEKNVLTDAAKAATGR